MSDTDQPDNAADDAGLTKQKKPRSDAQKAAFEKARTAQAAKREEKAVAANGGKPDPDIDRKKLILRAVKEKLNGEPKSQVVYETESESDDEPAPPPPKKSHKKKVESPPPVKAKKEPKVVYEEDSDTEEEIVVVKKRKKPKRKTIIYEESESEDEPEPPKKAAQPSRETKSQLNTKSFFKVTPGKADAPKSLYYFAD